MNKREYRVVVLLMVVVFAVLCRTSITAKANTLSYGNYEYYLIGAEATITKYKDTAVESLEIPAEIDGNTVVEIASGAFSECNNLKNVILPESLTRLGCEVFTSPYITSITIPKNVTEMGRGYSVGYSTFTGCKNLETVIFEEGMTKIPDIALYCCTSVKNVVIPEGVIELGNRSLRATSIESLELPSTLEIIGANSIWECEKLKTIKIPEKVTSIGFEGFAGNIALESVEFPEGLQSIGTSAFSGCNNLKNVTLPESLTTLGCEVFTSPYITSITIPKNVTEMGRGYSVGYSTFTGCKNLETVIFEEGMTRIPDIALYCCTSVKNVVIPEGVIELGNRSLRATSIESLELPSTLEIIGANSVWECEKLKNIEIPENVTNIEAEAFYGNIALGRVQIPKATKYISSSTFQECPQLIICGYEGSYAQTYAGELNIPFEVIDEEAIESITKIAVSKKTYYGANYYDNTAEGDIYDDAKAFVDAMDNYLVELKKATQQDAKTEKKQKKSAAEKLKERDALTSDKIITMEVALPKAALDSVYEALAQYLDMYVEEGVQLGKIDMSANSIEVSTSIVNKIRNNLKTLNFSRKIGQYTVSFDVIKFLWAYSGSVIVQGNGRTYYGTIVSGSDDTAKVMTEYINTLYEWEKDALYEAYTSIFSGLTEVTGIADFTKNDIKSLLKDKVDLLRSKGYGDLLRYCTEIRDGYEIVNKITAAKDASSLSDVLNSVESIYKKIEKLDYSDEGVTKKLVSLAMNRLMNAKEQLERDLYDYVYSGKSQGNENWVTKTWNSFKSLFIQCPVDIIIHDSEKNVIGQITDTDYTCSQDIHIEVDNDVKTVIIPNDMDVQLEFIGSDVGDMTYVIEQYEDGEIVGRANYYDISLEEGKQFLQELGAGSISEEFQGDIQTEGEMIQPSEYLAASDENAYITIESDQNKGGMILGTGVYPKGDPVVLNAYPDAGYCFKGWYLDGKLVELSSVYRMAALENLRVYAEFEKIKEREQLYGIEIAASYTDTTDFQVYKNEDQTNDIWICMSGDLKLEELKVKIKKMKNSAMQTEEEIYDTIYDGVGRFLIPSVDVQGINSLEIYEAQEDKWIGNIYYFEEDIAEDKKHDFSKQPYFTDDAGKHYQKCKECEIESEHVKCTPGKAVKEDIVTATCAVNGSHKDVVYCTICSQKLSTILVSDEKTENHDYKKCVTPATFTINGKKEMICNLCGKITNLTTIYAAKTVNLSFTVHTYNGKTKIPTVIIRDMKGNIINKEHYKIIYPSKSKNVGKYTVKVVFKGDHSGTKNLSYKINPPKTTIQKVTAGKKNVTVKWKKRTTQVTGYQLQYSASSTFKNGNKVITNKSNNMISSKIKGLKSGKKYYVRVRTYKIVKGKKYYSAWSTKKSIKINKYSK